MLACVYLMNSINPKHIEARSMLVQDAMDKIINVPNFCDFYQRSFCVIAKFGLQLKAKEEKLFATESWGNPECKDELIGNIRKFLNRYIR